jgi:hypothetical protein
MWENIVGQATDDNIASGHFMLDTWGYKRTYSEYAIIMDFPLQKWLQESGSKLRYTCIACLVNYYFKICRLEKFNRSDF